MHTVPHVIYRYGRSYPKTFWMMIFLSLLGGIEGVLSPWILSKLTMAIMKKDFFKVKILVGALFALYVFIYVIYAADLFIIEKLAGELKLFINQEMLRMFFKNFSTGIEDSHVSLLQSNLHLYSAAVIRQVVIFRNNLLTPFIMLIYQSLFIAFTLDLILGFIIFGIFGVVLAVIIWAYAAKSLAGNHMIESELSFYEQVSDVLDNFSTVVSSEPEKINAEVNSVNGMEYLISSNIVFANVATITTCAFIGIILFQMLFMARFYKLFATKLRKNSAEKTIYSFLIIFRVLISARDILYYTEDIVIDSAVVTRAFRTFTRPFPVPLSVTFSSSSFMGLEISNLSFDYHGKVVFSGFSETFNAGEITVIKGKNGAGKTTLLRLISGFAGPPSSGTISFPKGGETKVQYVRQNAVLFARTILENIIYNSLEAPLSLDEFSEKERDTYLKLNALEPTLWEELFEGRMNLFTTVERGGKNLSGGQRQMIQVLRLFFSGPTDILLLDEITSALDISKTEMIIKLLKEYRSQNPSTVILFVTHDDEVAGLLADRIVNL